MSHKKTVLETNVSVPSLQPSPENTSHDRSSPLGGPLHPEDIEANRTPLVLTDIHTLSEDESEKIISEHQSSVSKDVEAVMDRYVHVGLAHFLSISFGLGFANAADASDVTAIGFIVDELRSDHVSSTLSGIVAAAVFVGMLVGGLAMGFVGDKFGRRRPLLISIALNAIFSLLSAAAPEPYTLAICRMLAGVGVGGSMPPCFSLAVELCPPSWRGRCIIWIAWNWVVGSLYTAGAAWVIMGIYEESWRYFALAAAAPAVFCTIFTYFFIPESPIYLATHGRPVHAASIVASLAHRPGCLGHKLKNKGNGTNAFVPGTHKSTNINITAITARGEESNETDQLVTVYSDVENDDEGEDYQVRIHLNQAKHTQAQSEGEEKERGHLHRLPAWADACAKRWRPSLEVRKASYFLRNLQGGRIKQSWRSIKGSVSEMYGGDLLRTSIALQLAWFSLAVSSYGLSVWIPTIYDRVGFEASKYMNVFIFSAAQIPSAVLSFFFIDHPYIGRRGLLIISSIVSAIFTVAFALKHDGPTVAVLFSSLFQMASTVAWNALDALATESFPVQVRSAAFAVQAASGRIGAIIAQFVFSMLVDDHVVVLNIICAILLLGTAICGIVLRFGPDATASAHH